MSRFTIDLTPRFERYVTKLANTLEVSKAEAVRRAVERYSEMLEEVEKGTEQGWKLSVTGRDDKIVKELGR